MLESAHASRKNHVVNLQQIHWLRGEILAKCCRDFLSRNVVEIKKINCQSNVVADSHLSCFDSDLAASFI